MRCIRPLILMNGKKRREICKLQNVSAISKYVQLFQEGIWPEKYADK